MLNLRKALKTEKIHGGAINLKNAKKDLKYLLMLKEEYSAFIKEIDKIAKKKKK